MDIGVIESTPAHWHLDVLGGSEMTFKPLSDFDLMTPFATEEWHPDMLARLREQGRRANSLAEAVKDLKPLSPGYWQEKVITTEDWEILSPLRQALAAYFGSGDTGAQTPDGDLGEQEKE